MTFSKIRSILIIFAFFVSLPVFSNSTSKSKDYFYPRKIKLQLLWKHQFQFAGYYAAIEKGFYKKAGLVIELVEANELQKSTEIVFQNKADFGIASTNLILELSKGYKPVILASIFQHSANVILGSKKAGIESVHDLYGKKIMFESHAADMITYLNNEGISTANFETMHPSFDVNDLLVGKVDAMSAYITDEPYILKQNKFDFTIISPLNAGIDFYGDLLFTSQDYLKQNPEIVRKFREASLQGWNYAINNKNEIVNLIYDKYSQRHSKEHLLYEANKMDQLIMANLVEIGYTNPDRIARIIQIYKEKGMINSKINSEGLLYNDYLHHKSNINWLYTGILMAIILMVSFALFIFYRLSNKLKQEIKEHKQAEIALKESEKQLRNSNSTKDKFFAIIAHDLKGPLGNFKQVTNLLVDSFDQMNEKETLDFLILMKDSTNNLYTLLEDLLDWSRSQNGTISFNKELFNLLNFSNDVIKILKPLADKKLIQIENNIPSNIMINADGNMLQTILRNLISNSIKFTKPNGKVVLNAIEDENSVFIKIKDNGIGIDKEIVDKLFKIEESISSLGTNQEKGTGLGLILCKEFVEYHHGNIWLDENSKQGSTFVVKIPN